MSDARRAAFLALRESLTSDKVMVQHFVGALSETRLVAPEMEREYEEMLRTLKQQEPRQRIGFLAQAAE